MTITHHITADQLEAMGSDARYELIQGALHQMSPSNIDSSEIAMRLGIVLGAFIYQHQLGILVGENGGFRIETNPDTVLAPDLGFIKRDRLYLRIPGKFFPSHPDLAVEVISISDERADIRRKQEIYDRIGTPLVWWIDPRHRAATIHAAGQPVRNLRESDRLDGEAVVPGFTVRLATLFDDMALPSP